MATFRRPFAALSLALGLVTALAANCPAWAAIDAPAPQATAQAAPPAAKASEKPSLEPFLPAKSVHQFAIIGNKKVDYVLTVGSIPLKDEKGEVTGEVVYTA